MTTALRVTDAVAEAAVGEPQARFELISIPLSEQRDVAALRSQGLWLSRWGMAEEALADAFIGSVSAITQAMIDSGDPGHAEFSLAHDGARRLIQIELCIHPGSDTGPGPALATQLQSLGEGYDLRHSYHRHNGEIVQVLQLPILSKIEISARTAAEWRERLLGQSDYSTVDLLRLQNHELTRAMERRRRQEEQLRARLAQIETLNRELRNVNEELRHARRVAEEAAASKSQFLAHMSHEIRTPMNAIAGMIEVMQDEPLNPHQKSCVDTIRAGSDHLLHLINNVLDYSKLNAGHFQLENKSLSIYHLVEASIEMVAQRAADRGLRLAYTIDESVPDLLLGDEVRIRQILVNYLSNAVKFTRQGSIQVFVAATARDSELELEFCVADTGPGMEEQVRSRLFVDYVQADASTGAAFGGTGLGLAISRKLAMAMGGRTWVESKLGKGSRFYFTVTATPDRRQPAFRSEPRLDGVRLLVVTDDALTGDSILRTAKRAGMDVDLVASAAEAQERLARTQPAYDLALLDQGLSNADTDQLASRIKSLERHPHLVLLCPAGETCVSADLYRGAVHTPLIQSRFARRIARYLGHSELAERSTESGTRETVPSRPRRTGDASHHTEDETSLRILLVEDNPVNQQVASLMLKKLGYENVAIAPSGEIALEMLSERSVDVVLMDIQLGGIDGRETSRRIRRQLPRESQPWIIAVTANVMDGEREACCAAGMNDYLSKPVVRKTLGQALAQVRERRRPE